MNEKLIAFLDKYGLEGSYDGGGDSGGIEDFDTREGTDGSIDMYKLQEWVYDNTLSEYVGWAWNGGASGTIRYDAAEKKIFVEGTEYSDEDPTERFRFALEFTDFFSEADLKRIDSINIYFTDGDEPNLRVNVLSGPWTDSLEASEKKLLAKLESLADEYDGYKYWIDQSFTTDESVEFSIGEIVHVDKNWEIDLTEVEYDEEEVTNG